MTSSKEGNSMLLPGRWKRRLDADLRAVSRVLAVGFLGFWLLLLLAHTLLLWLQSAVF
jgi:hypothetical protein